jgi:hypothetical protein
MFVSSMAGQGLSRLSLPHRGSSRAGGFSFTIGLGGLGTHRELQS